MKNEVIRLKRNLHPKDGQRLSRIMTEFINGHQSLSKVSKAVSIYGSAKLGSGDKYYQLAEEIAYLLAKAGFAIITGGGPGIMEAGNLGAQKAKGLSIGLAIQQIDGEQESNEYIDTLLEHHYFFVRKFMFVKYAKAFVIIPGGFGTLDELFECLNLIRTERIDKIPVILVGSEYYGGLVNWMKSEMVRAGCINESALNIFKLVDEPKEVVQVITDFYGNP